MQNRREFLRKAAIGGGLLLAGGFPFASLAASRSMRLTILHTNDVHSRLEPFPDDGSRHAGLGGVAARASLIKKVRQEEEHVLLFDSGDIFQGTPYFNLYKGEPEIRSLSMMQYDAVTMGNHDFDAGVEGFAMQLQHANFPVLTSNYDFAGTALEGKTKDYQVFSKGRLRVGVFGIGIELKGLVPDEAFGATRYLDPVHTAQATADQLRKREKCDFVICLSHLGYEYASGRISDVSLAKKTEGIDVILGGHTHTFLDQPTVVSNRRGGSVYVAQAGWAGLRLGRLDFVFDNKKSTKLFNAQSVIIGKQTRAM